MNTAYWIEKLDLQIHPEGGFYKEIYRSKEFVEQKNLPDRFTINHSFFTSIYFLLSQNQISTFHKLQADEIWYYHKGSALIIHIISPDGEYYKSKLGLCIESGESPQVIIPHNHWFGAELLDKSTYSLLSCSVSPGFEFSDFELAKRGELLSEFPQHKKLILKMTDL